KRLARSRAALEIVGRWTDGCGRARFRVISRSKRQPLGTAGLANCSSCRKSRYPPSRADLRIPASSRAHAAPARFDPLLSRTGGILEMKRQARVLTKPINVSFG